MKAEKRSQVGWVALGIALLAIGAANPAGADVWKNPRDLTYPKLGAIQIPEPDRITLDNGMVIYLLEDHEFPLVDARALMRVGSIYDPADKVGLASITGKVMRTGGSEKIDGDALDEMLESMGASVEISIGQTRGTATVSTLTEDFGKGLEILAGLLRQPTFPEDKIDLAKKQERTAIASRNDEPLNILTRELPKLIYGEGHPYARYTEYATIAAITRDDLVAFHKEFIHPDRIILTVYGDFDSQAVRDELQRVFGDWPPATTPLPPDPEVTENSVAGNFLIDKEDMTNSFVAVGQVGMRMDDPDYPALRLFHTILGGGFSSRLFNEIRTKRGLAYATGSMPGADLHHPRAQLFYAATKSDSTVATLGYLRAEIQKALAEPFTEEEIRRAKDQILNSMVFDLSSKFAVLNRLASYEFYGYPRDFLQKYQERIRELTAQEVLDAARRKIHYAQMATLLLGNSKNFAASLKSLGEVKQIDITIPEPEGEEIPMGTAADLERGRGLLQAAAEASGGSSLESIRDFVLEENGIFSVQGMELQVSSKTVRKLPDCEFNEQKLPMGTFTQALCGDDGWVDRMKGPEKMPPELLQESRISQVRDYLNVLGSFGDWKLQALPDQVEVEGHPCDVVYVRNDLVQGWKIYLDAQTHRIIRMDYRDRSMMTGAPVHAQELFGDYRTVAGIAWPYERKILHDGELIATLTTTSLKVNTGVDPEVFAMPSQ